MMMEPEISENDIESSSREYSRKFFNFQPLNKTFIDSYNHYTNTTLPKFITESEIHYFSKEFIGVVRFENLILMPPFQDKNSVTSILDKMKQGSLGSSKPETFMNFLEKSIGDEPVKPAPDWLTPAACRDKSEDYMLSVYADIIHIQKPRTIKDQLKDYEDTDGRSKKANIGIEVAETIFEDYDTESTKRCHRFVELFKIPLMTGSDWDWRVLSKAPISDWSFFQECPAQPFGDFYINGNSKIFVTQEKLSQNIHRCISIKKNIICEIRSTNIQGRSITASLTVFALSAKNRVANMFIIALDLPFLTKGEDKPRFNVLEIFRLYAIWGLYKKNDKIYTMDDEIENAENSTKIALGELSRYLSIITNTKTTQVVANYLAHSISKLVSFSKKGDTSDYAFIYERANKLGLSDSASSVLKLKIIMQKLRDEFLPHLNDWGSEYETKSEWSPFVKLYMLTMMIVRFVKCKLGKKKLDDRNTAVTKDYATVGIELAVLTKKAFNDAKRIIILELKKGIKDSVSKTIQRACAKHVTGPIRKSFSTGEWGSLNSNKRTGVVQANEKASIPAMIYMLRKISIPAKKKSKLAKPRKVPPSTYGLVDPTNTPDSDQVGIVKALAVSVYITNNDNEAETWLYNMVEKIREDMTKDNEEINNQPIIVDHLTDDAIGEQEVRPLFINNKWVGIANYAAFRFFKQERRKSNLGLYTEIFEKIEHDELEVVKEFHMLTTEGRAVKPWFVVENNKFLGLEKGYMLPEKAKAKDTSFEVLIREGVVRFVGPNEFEHSEFAIDYKTFKLESEAPDKRNFDFIELDKSFQYAVEAGLQPYPQLNPIPRIMYRGNQVRQAQSIPFSTFNYRQDTDLKILNYSQAPLIRTDMMAITGLDQQPYGLNVTVAVMSTGFSDEDATVWKRSFFERGGFNSTLFETYEIDGNDLVEDLSADRIKYDPGLIRVKKKIREERIQKELRKEAGIKESEKEEWPFKNIPELHGNTNVLVSPGETLARMKATQSQEASIQEKKLKGNRKMFVHSTHSFSSTGNKKVQKVVVRFPHIPGVGDKFSGPAGQKGVIGEVRDDVDMPFTRDGTTPDVIFSPTSFASRMTVAMFVELLTGKASVACNRNQFVKRLVEWSPGFKQVKIIKDFYIKLDPLLVRTDAANQKQQFLRVDDIAEKVRRQINAWNRKGSSRTKDKKTKRRKKVLKSEIIVDNEVKKLKFREDYVLRLADLRNDRQKADFEDEILSKYIKKYKGLGWKQREGFSLNLGKLSRGNRTVGHRVRYFVPELSHTTILKTGERHILYSQLSDELQIQWYRQNKNIILPRFRIKNMKNLDAESEKLRDATAFRDPDQEAIMQMMKDKGYSYSGKEVMYSGRTGKPLDALIFTGICYYLHLKQLVQSKQQVRDEGSVSWSTRAPQKGKSSGGAVKYGEMSRVAVLAHGATHFLKEKFQQSADESSFLVCQLCNNICYEQTSSRIIQCDTCGQQKNPLRITTTWALRKQQMLIGAAGGNLKFLTKPTFEARKKEEIREKFDPRRRSKPRTSFGTRSVEIHSLTDLSGDANTNN